MPLIISRGVNGVGSSEFGAYWDVFNESDKWVYARQDLDLSQKDF